MLRNFVESRNKVSKYLGLVAYCVEGDSWEKWVSKQVCGGTQREKGEIDRGG